MYPRIKISPEQYCEDNHRLALDPSSVCTWSSYTGVQYPRGKKKWWMFRYRKHKQRLQAAFNSSTLDLRVTPKGFGVFAKQPICPTSREVSRLLTATVQKSVHRGHWSQVLIREKVKRLGRPQTVTRSSAFVSSQPTNMERRIGIPCYVTAEKEKIEPSNTPEEKIEPSNTVRSSTREATLAAKKRFRDWQDIPRRVKRAKYERRVRALVGPLNYVNHACYRHANCLWVKGRHCFYVKPKRYIETNEELTISYGFTPQELALTGVVCELCSK
jgi:hypothetical protein